jgi:hypothetical protein
MQDDQKKVLISSGHTGVQRLRSPTIESIQDGSTSPFHGQDAGTNHCGNRAPDLQSDGRSLTDIPACWKEFLAIHAAARIPHRVIPSVMYAVYSGYASDWTGEYSYLLGCGVTKAATPPKGLAVRQIPAQTYARIFPLAGRCRMP